MSILNLQKGKSFNQSGIFGPCRGQINTEVSGDIPSAYRTVPWGVVESTECCLAHCRSPQQTCIEHCANDEECKETCDRQSALCARTCFVVDPIWSAKENPYLQCAYQQGCLSTGTSIDCLNTHKDEIMSCCKSDKCVPRQNVNCDKVCEFTAKMVFSEGGKYSTNPTLEIDHVLKKIVREKGDVDNISEYFDLYGNNSTNRRVHPWRRTKKGYN